MLIKIVDTGPFPLSILDSITTPLAFPENEAFRSKISDCNKTQVWELGKELGILKEIIAAPPTDGLWDDGRTDEGQLGLKYNELEEAMDNPNSPNRVKYESIRKQNMHKMEPIPVCKIPN